MERIYFLLKELIRVNRGDTSPPDDYSEKRYLLRSLMNVTDPAGLTEEYFTMEREFLEDELEMKKITRSKDVTERLFDKVYLWKGDITTLEVDAIVNAANSKLLGCFVPHHRCIDNAIHSAAGLSLRKECQKIMTKQGRDEETGYAKLTGAYSLPSRYVIHTVGPIVANGLTEMHKEKLASCYRSCLDIVKRKDDIRTIAFCSISTGEFRFPIEEASQVALETIRDYVKDYGNTLDRVIINVFSQKDYNVYKRTAENCT